ncbi:DUF1493 family protein [Pseudomonas sp. EA_35y_Pfl2_R5]|uniref:DUF1493 family protein n=1 Tax=Pseudomonas sp. EA_35y_Pfl2_R5 TaxID=3088690 RepID=UPI0030D841A7
MDIEEIYNFLEKSQGVSRTKLSPKADLCRDLGIDGDDFFELAEDFASKYNVSMNTYCWYFHHNEEGFNIGALFSPAPYQQVKRIPVTPEILLLAATEKTWPVIYPAHEISKNRTDIIINQFILTALLCFVAICVLIEFA